MKALRLPPQFKGEERKKYWDFFSKILTTVPSLPEEDYAVLCGAWKEALKADWIWLFLLDSSLGPRNVLQLVGASIDAPLPPPSQFRVENCKSVATYCLQTTEPEVVDDPSDGHWKGLWNDETYLVWFSDVLKREGCKRVICVPVILPSVLDSNASTIGLAHPQIEGGICIYYKSSPSGKPNAGVLKMMGLLSAQSILNSYQALQRDIFLELNQIAHEYLTTSGRPPREMCKCYVSKVIGVIKNYLRVDGVSIFYRDTLRGGVQCLHSTGLVRVGENGVISPISEENIEEVNYQPGVGATGKCYKSGRPVFLVTGMVGREIPKTAEAIGGQPALAMPAVIYPIPLAKGEGKDSSGNQSLGVIRCKFHHADFSKNDGLCFDAIEVQTLDFIAKQIAPVLETFEVNISREAVISITKHDLTAPLDFIRYRATKPRYAEGSDPKADFVTINRYDLYDFGMCAMLALNLVRQFDVDPSTIRRADIELVNVGSGIIAPLKNMILHYAQETSQMGIHFENIEIIPNLWLDEILIQRAFFNLLINAVKYGKRKSTIRIVGRQGQAGYNIDVINEGFGVDADEEPLIFQPGYRSPRVKNVRIGLGLGLPIARACVEKCGGNLYLLARRNPTVFSVFFPRILTKKPKITDDPE
jgi:hypothetical protein